MTKLEKAKSIIKENIHNAPCGIFNTRNNVNDSMVNLYTGDGLVIDICYSWMYFEVFGLLKDEFRELENYYDEL